MGWQIRFRPFQTHACVRGIRVRLAKADWAGWALRPQSTVHHAVGRRTGSDNLSQANKFGLPQETSDSLDVGRILKADAIVSVFLGVVSKRIKKVKGGPSIAADVALWIQVQYSIWPVQHSRERTPFQRPEPETRLKLGKVLEPRLPELFIVKGVNHPPTGFFGKDVKAIHEVAAMITEQRMPVRIKVHPTGLSAFSRG